jgi:hypothetical protein
MSNFVAQVEPQLAQALKTMEAAQRGGPRAYPKSDDQKRWDAVSKAFVEMAETIRGLARELDARSA